MNLLTDVMYGPTMNINGAIRKTVHFMASAILSKMVKIIAMMLIVYAIVSAYIRILNYSEGYYNNIGICFTIGIVLQIAFGTMILIDFSNNFSRGIGLFAMSMAINRFTSNLPYLAEPRGLQFVYALIMIAIAVNMLYTGYSFARGRTRSRIGLMCSSLLMLSLTMGKIYYHADSYDVPGELIFTTYPDQCIACIMYIILFVMVSSEQVRDNMPTHVYLRTLGSIRCIKASEPSSYIMRCDARTLLNAFIDRKDWSDVGDGGPVECEFKCTLYNYLGDESMIMVQKWVDHDSLYITITGSKDGSILNAYRTSIDDISADGPIETCDTLFMYGGQGSEYRLRVRDEVEEW